MAVYPPPSENPPIFNPNDFTFSITPEHLDGTYLRLNAQQNENMNGFKITNMAAATDPTDAVIFSQLTTSADLPLAGGTMDAGAVINFTDNIMLNQLANADGSYNVAIGFDAGTTDQSANAIAIGTSAGSTGQGQWCIAIGDEAGNSGQATPASIGNCSIAIGKSAGKTDQGNTSIAIGLDAGKNTQGSLCIAIGSGAGETTQGNNSIGIGSGAGKTQGASSVAIGDGTGYTQGDNCVAIGFEAGSLVGGQQDKAVALGFEAGRDNQGSSSIAIGASAGLTNQNNNSIILNATGSALNSIEDSAVYLRPIRGNFNTSSAMYYNTGTHEVTYSNVKSFVIDHPTKEDYKLLHSCVESPQIDLNYRGTIKLKDGYGEVNIDEKFKMENGTFEALCRDVQSFTSNETGWSAVRSKVVGNILQVESAPNGMANDDTISWLVIGERKDEGLKKCPKTDEEGRLITEQPNSIARNWGSNC